MTKFWPIIFVLLFTPWIDRLMSNPVVALITISTSVILYIFTVELPGKSRTKYRNALIFLFVILLATQITTTQRQNLLEITNDDIRYRDEKLKSYPPVGITIGNKTLWIPAAHWFEGRGEYLAYQRIENNLFENLDPGNFFFAGSPRPRVEVREFEKFLYIFLPFFIYGMFVLIVKNWRLVAATTLPFLTLLTLIGNKNSLGPFVLAPIIAVAIAFGIKPIFDCKNEVYLYILITLTILVYIQIYAYESF